MGWRQRASNRNPIQIYTPAEITPELLRASAAFGLIPKTINQTQPKQDPPSDETFEQILKHRIVFIRGASGSGKSSLIRGLHSKLLKKNHKVHTTGSYPIKCDRRTAIIDRLDNNLQSRVSSLSRAGLAEPSLWALPYSCLSVGQQARFEMVLVMQHASKGDVVIADEFGTPLDRVCAYSFARTIRRWAIEKGVILICATAHEDMEQMISPEFVIDLDDQKHRYPKPSIDQLIHIETGTYKDYKSLAHHHYLGSDPATHTLILRATRHLNGSQRILAGILVVSMPTLNGSWRNRAWPGFFNSSSKSQNAKTINTHLRCISRVIVAPSSRGLGVATKLVREYLENPQTSSSEAIAAMGSVCPFLERAGMQSYEMIPSIDDLRLLDVLEHHNMTITDLVRSEIDHRSHLGVELIRWGKRRKLISKDHHPSEILRNITLGAACRLISKPRAYAHTNMHHVESTGDQCK